MQRFQVLVLAALAATGAGGCMGREHRPHHTVTITTEPAGAACLVTAGAEPVAELPATPAVVRVPQASPDVRVFCTAAGRAPAAAVLPAEFDAARVALAAALVGPAPVAGMVLAGAGRRFAPALNLALPAMSFPTAQERELFFAARATETRRHFDQPIRAHKTMCRADEFGCQHMIAEMERARDEELSRLEALRGSTPATE